MPTCQLGLAFDGLVSIPVVVRVRLPGTLEQSFLLSYDTSEVSVSGYPGLVVSL